MIYIKINSRYTYTYILSVYKKFSTSIKIYFINDKISVLEYETKYLISY